jgi:pSer/pThr/pTyr-binding forkhead associated (FHA) protein
MKPAQLTVIHGSAEHIQQVFLLPGDQQILLGRSSICHFQIEDPRLSTLHCYFSSKEGVFSVCDLLSANGVFVNKKLVDVATLQEGDIVKVGNTLLEFSDGREFPKGKPEPDKSESEESETCVTLGRMIKKERDLTVCRLGLKNHLLTHKEIRKLIDLQKNSARDGKATHLTDLLVSEKLLTKENIEKLLQEHEYNKVRHKDIHFSKIVLGQSMASPENVEECLVLQDRYFHETGQVPRLGEILVQKGYLTVRQNNKVIKILKEKKASSER